MKDTISRNLSRPFARFVFSGGVAAAANILSRIALSQAMDYTIAIVVAYLIGMTTAYVLMKLFVFEQSGRAMTQEYIRFGLVNLVALAQVWLVSVVLASFVFPASGFEFHADTIAHVIGVLSPTATSYFMHKHFTFSETGR
jgi:putative flippase GtrA